MTLFDHIYPQTGNTEYLNLKKVFFNVFEFILKSIRRLNWKMYYILHIFSMDCFQRLYPDKMSGSRKGANPDFKGFIYKF